MRRVRAIPRAQSQSASFGVGIQLRRSGISRAGAQGAESTDTDTGGGTDADPTCATPAAMRWRYYPSWLGYSSSTVVEDSDPPDWPYSFESFAVAEYASADVPHDVDGYLIESADTVAIQMLDNVVSFGLGYWLIDLVDADGAAIDLRTNYNLACFGPDANDNSEVIEWAVRYVQFDLGSPSRAIPQVDRMPDGTLVLVVNTAEMNAGTLTISATDNWSPGAPQEFGPLTFIFGEPE